MMRALKLTVILDTYYYDYESFYNLTISLFL